MAGGLVVLLLALAGRYGPHRDELYFVAAGQHPAWGYPDQPALTPLIAAATQWIAPRSVWALHVPPALTAGLLCLVAAATARELGGRAWAQTLTAYATATGATFLVVGHELSTTSLDVLAWGLLVWLALRSLRTGHARDWLLLGFVAGVALENKTLVVALLAALALASAALPETRRRLASPWPWAAVGVAFLLWAPNLVWQARHGWPQLHLVADVNGEYGGPGERIAFVVFTVIAVTPTAVLLWGRGLADSWRRPSHPAARLMALTYALLFAVFLVSGGKGYYLAGLYPPLLAAGAVALERRHAQGGARATRWVALLALGVLPVLPALVPLLPQEVYARSFFPPINEDQREMIGWPRLVGDVAAVRDTLAPGQRAQVVILTSNYGEAGAIAWYGPSHGLPAPYSGHNGYALWGPPSGAGPVITVGTSDAQTRFASALDGCRPARVVRTGADNAEDGAVISVCTGPRGGWQAAWPRLVHLSA